MDIPPPPQPTPSPEDAPPPGAVPTQADGPSYTDAVPAPAAPSFDAAATVSADAPAPAPQPAGGPAGPPPVPPVPGGADTPVPSPPVPPVSGGDGGAGAGLPPYPHPEQQPPFGGAPGWGQQPPGPYPYGQQPYGAGPYPAGGPYGPVGGPYGYPGHGGWYAPAEQQSTNGLAIASLVVSLTVGCVPFLAAILGIVSLRQIRRNGQRGRGLAIAGIVINAVGTVVMALIVTLAVIGALDEGNTKVQDLKAGQCFNTVGHSLSDYGDAGTRSTSVDVVPCGDEHDAEAYAVFSVDPALGEDYPGEDRIAQDADEKCGSYADSYLGDSTLPDGLDIYYYLPPREGWDRGDRAVTCFFGSLDGKVSGTAKSGDGSGVGV